MSSGVVPKIDMAYGVLTTVRGDPKAHLSFPANFSDRGGRDSCPWPESQMPSIHLFMLSAKLHREALSIIFKVFGMTRPGFEPTTFRHSGEHSTSRPLIGLGGSIKSFALVAQLVGWLKCRFRVHAFEYYSRSIIIHSNGFD